MKLTGWFNQSCSETGYSCVILNLGRPQPTRPSLPLFNSEVPKALATWPAVKLTGLQNSLCTSEHSSGAVTQCKCAVYMHMLMRTFVTISSTVRLSTPVTLGQDGQESSPHSGKEPLCTKLVLHACILACVQVTRATHVRTWVTSTHVRLSAYCLLRSSRRCRHVHSTQVHVRSHMVKTWSTRTKTTNLFFRI